MARVFIPTQWLDLTAGTGEIDVPGESMAEVIAALEARFPGIRDRLCPDGEIANGLAVSIDGSIASRGVRSAVKPTSEIHFLPAIGGG